MAYQIDQSVKIEQTNRDTIIALSNDIVYTVIIPAKVKRQIKQQFRQQGKPYLFYYHTFAAGVALLLKDLLKKKKIDMVVIDREYVGRENLIEKMILEILKELHCKEPQIYFKEIGRKSNAHNMAYLTMKKKRKPDKIIGLKELQKLIFKK